MTLVDRSATVFVTGASGFIGGRLVAELLSRGRSVRALIRPGADRTRFPRRGVSFVVGDLSNQDFLAWAMAGCGDAFHLAAYARNWAARRGIFFAVNVAGTRNLLEAAGRAGVQRIVYASTIVTLGPTPPGVTGDEAMPRWTQSYFTDYEESKTIAERQALRLASEGVPVIVANPTRVYGPGKLTESNSVTWLCDLHLRGRAPFLLDGGRSVGNYVLVDDLVRGLILSLERGRVGERYILGGENASQERLFDLLDEIEGRRRRRVPLPRRLALAYARFEQAKAERLGVHPRITPGWVETFFADWAYTSRKAERELGYAPTPLKDGLRLTYDWLRSRRRREGGEP